MAFLISGEAHEATVSNIAAEFNQYTLVSSDRSWVWSRYAEELCGIMK